MKVLTYFFFAILLLNSCSTNDQESSETKPEQAAFPPNIQKLVEHINYLDSTQFTSANLTIKAVSQSNFENQIDITDKKIIEKFCNQSKGYQQGVWEGENDCSWAIEKHKLEQWKDKVQRSGDTLKLALNQY